MRVCWCRHLYNRMSERMPILWRANASDCGFATVPISGGDSGPSALRKKTFYGGGEGGMGV